MTSCPPAYALDAREIALDQENLMIQEAISILERRMFTRGPLFEHPQHVTDYLRLKLAGEKREVFSCIFLDSSHSIIAYEPLFYGTIDTTSVSPRIILQRALELNCAALIMAHNHPSGNINPSKADRALTIRVRELLATADVRVLDHFIVGKGDPYSLAAAGYL